MRNLKRALSMLLSSTMVLGMVAMGGSAAGYQDVDDSYNKEAIEVLQAVGIMTGDENGDFNPDGIVTRNEMAVIMSNLMAYNVATYAGTSPFTDVPEWAEPYVAACYTNGITAGISDTLYGGDQTVTTSQAALMIMKALGYFQYQSDFGGDWQLSSITQRLSNVYPAACRKEMFWRELICVREKCRRVYGNVTKRCRRRPRRMKR